MCVYIISITYRTVITLRRSHHQETDSTCVNTPSVAQRNRHSQPINRLDLCQQRARHNQSTVVANTQSRCAGQCRNGS